MEFDPFSTDYFEGAWATYRWLRDEAPVYQNDRLGFFALSRYEDVSAALRDYETFISSEGVILHQLLNSEFKGSASVPGAMLFYDPPEHTRLRNLTKKAFTPRAVAGLEVLVRENVLRHLAPVEASGEFDFVEGFSKRFTTEVISAMLGVPESERDAVWELCELFIYAGEGMNNEHALRAQAEIYQYFGELVARRRRSPDAEADDMVTNLIRASFVDEFGDTQYLSDAEICGYCFLLYIAGIETTTKLLGSAIVEFDRNPSQWARIVDDRSLIPGAVEEIGRFAPPAQYLGRRLTKDLDLHGASIPAGASVLLLIAAANRDERVFPDPDRFDITRKMERPPATYGFGPHACIGMTVARLEARVALEEIAARWTSFEVDHGGLKRTQNVNLAGFSSVPVRLRAPVKN